MSILDSGGVDISRYSTALRREVAGRRKRFEIEGDDFRRALEMAQHNPFFEEAYQYLKIAQYIARLRGQRAIDTASFMQAIIREVVRWGTVAGPAAIRWLVDTPLREVFEGYCVSGSADDPDVGIEAIWSTAGTLQ